MRTLSFIDVFAGASGMSEGFVNAGFTPIAHIEMKQEACATIETRIAYHYLRASNQLDTYNSYLKQSLPREELMSKIPNDKRGAVLNFAISDESIQEIFNLISPKVTEGVDLLIGGPPCQAYSLLGRHSIDVENDPRNLLFVQYGKFLKKYKPKVFVFENVLGLLTAYKGKYFNDLKDHFRELGYIVHCKILNAADYGVLQNRKRIIIVGWQKKIDAGFPELEITRSPIVVNDLFDDLPALKPGGGAAVMDYARKPNAYLSKTGICSELDFVTQHMTRPHNDRDLAIYKEVIWKWNAENARLKYSELPENLRTHKNVSSFLDRFKVVDGLGYSHTVVAHIAKDGHHYIHPDIKQCRSISIREAARLQSFPDNFFFEGSRSAVFAQIGNAVPPMMSFAIASKLKEMI